jgi:L-iditol 2-dehydrogenase
MISLTLIGKSAKLNESLKIKLMEAIVFKSPNLFTFDKNYPIPTLNEGDILLKVLACGFCGTDYKIFKNGHRAVSPPRVIGHEIVGEIFKINRKNEKEYEIGDRVIVVTPVGCTKCNYCKKGRTNMCPLVAKDVHSIGYYTDGGFAQYCLIPKEAVEQKVLIKIPDSVSDEEAAICEPFSCVINGQDKLKIVPEDTVVIIGAGPIGCLHGLLAKSQGVSNIIMLDVSQDKLDLSKKVLPEAIFINNSKLDAKERIFELTDQAGADVVIVAAPSQAAQKLSIEITGILGRISFFAGLPKGVQETQINTNLIHYNEIEVYGSFASYRSQYIRALDLIKNKQIKVDKLITHSLPLQDIEKAMKLFESGLTLKTVIIP